MKTADRREVVKVDHTPAVELVSVKPWRDELDADDQKTVADALDYAKFWEGAANYSWKILVAKLVNLLDGEH